MRALLDYGPAGMRSTGASGSIHHRSNLYGFCSLNRYNNLSLLFFTLYRAMPTISQEFVMNAIRQITTMPGEYYDPESFRHHRVEVVLIA